MEIRQRKEARKDRGRKKTQKEGSITERALKEKKPPLATPLGPPHPPVPWVSPRLCYFIPSPSHPYNPFGNLDPSFDSEMLSLTCIHRASTLKARTGLLLLFTLWALRIFLS